jgi:hypothetical protein
MHGCQQRQRFVSRPWLVGRELGFIRRTSSRDLCLRGCYARHSVPAPAPGAGLRPRSMRRHSHVKDSPWRAGGGRTHTFGVRHAGSKLRNLGRLPTQRHRLLARQADFRGMKMGATSLKSRKDDCTFSPFLVESTSKELPIRANS